VKDQKGLQEEKLKRLEDWNSIREIIGGSRKQKKISILFKFEQN
jgi:hypothetical protein